MVLNFSLNVRVLVLAMVLLPGLISLGLWQLRREAEKEVILENAMSRQHQKPLEFHQRLSGDLAFMPVIVRGKFDPKHLYLLDNRVRQGQIGYEVLLPFQVENGSWVLINRGWVIAPPLRSELPIIPDVSSESIELVAEVYVPPGAPFTLGEPPENTAWPKVVTFVDIETMASQLGVNLFPYQLRLKSGQASALIIDWPTINVEPEKHRAYAIQWFAMALALVIWLLVANFSLRQSTESKSKKR